VTIHEGSSLREIAFEVCTALDRAGATAVLSGGGAATLYAPQAIQSFDLDFILTMHGGRAGTGHVLQELGYRLAGHHYEHAESKFIVEFPPGPLAIGDELITDWDTLREAAKLLHLITPTDACRDRLAAFYHFHDRSALDQALAIHAAQGKRIDLARIERWSEREGSSSRFAEFRRAIE
jgi:hypothetical protein